MEIMVKINKGTDLIKTKYLMKFKQKTYTGKMYDIKYLVEFNKKSNDILIVFTACTKKGQKARYNYIRTLEGIKCNKLFILDDFGFDGRGAYYLGKNKDFAIAIDVEKLIDEICKEVKAEKEIYIGSSKGAYAALYFGMGRKNTSIVAGAPQYRLGNYLYLPSHRNILNYIMGDESKESINKLNILMENRLKNNENNGNSIYLHYSNEEETFKSDIEPLIEALNNLNIKKKYDIHRYKNHSDLTLYFPKYIKDTLKKECNIL